MYAFIRKYRLYYVPFLLLTALLLYYKIRLIFSYAIDNAGLEYYFVHIIQLLSGGQSLYPNPEAYPHTNCLYTPAYFYIYGSLIQLFFSDIPTDLHTLFVLGRVLSLTLVFLQCYYLYKIIRKFNPTAFSVFLAITVYFVSLTDHMFATRPDALKLFFFSAFLYHHLEYHFFNGTRKHSIYAIFFALLAIFSKQDILLHISLCFALVFLVQRNRRSFYPSVAFVLSCTALFLIAYAVYGAYFFTNIIFLNLQQTENLQLSYLAYIIPLSILRTLPLLVIAGLNYKKAAEGTRGDMVRYISILSGLLYILSHFSLTRAGANINYTYELLFVLVLNIPLFLHLRTESTLKRQRGYYLLAIASVLFIISTNILLLKNNFDPARERIYQSEYKQYLADIPAVKSIIQKDTVFFPNTKYAIFYSDRNVITGHDMHLDRFIELYTNVAIKSRLSCINTESYDANFCNGTVKYILVEDSPKAQRHLSAYYPLYSYYQSAGHLLIYKFTPPNTLRTNVDIQH